MKPSHHELLALSENSLTKFYETEIHSSIKVDLNVKQLMRVS